MQFALMNSRALVTVKKLNRIFDRDDVIELRFIDQIDDCRERRTLAAAGWTSDQHDPGLHIDNLAQLLWQTKIFETRRPWRNHAHDDGVGPSLPKNIHTESIYPRQAERNI